MTISDKIYLKHLKEKKINKLLKLGNYNKRFCDNVYKRGQDSFVITLKSTFKGKDLFHICLTPSHSYNFQITMRKEYKFYETIASGTWFKKRDQEINQLKQEIFEELKKLNLPKYPKKYNEELKKAKRYNGYYS